MKGFFCTEVLGFICYFIFRKSQNIGVALIPGGIADFHNHVLQLGVFVTVVKCRRVETKSQIADVREHEDLAIIFAPGFGLYLLYYSLLQVGR